MSVEDVKIDPEEVKKIAERMGIPEEKYSEVFKALDILLEDLKPEQVEKLLSLSSELKDPGNMSALEAMNIVEKSGLDIEALQKKSRKKRAEEWQKNKKPRIGANELCPCNSGKKYKKCCRFKD